ncbi:MAG: DUF2254 domain-containing protein [Casimicrobiaceae bacterium]
MLNTLKSSLVAIRSSLWFVPTLMVGGAAVLALTLVQTDKRYAFNWATPYPLLFGAGAEGSRQMLSTIASSMITIAVLTFSLTIAALVTASAQYTSRILRNFMRDRRNQVVLGSFVGIFTYCLVVLRTIRSGAEGAFVPSLAVFVGLLLALLGIGVLVFFIHHIATSIQASTIIASITDETLVAIDKRFPKDTKDHQNAGDDVMPVMGAMGSAVSRRQVVRSNARGYVQNIDVSGIVELAAKHRATVQVNVPPGGFVARHARLLTIAADRALDDEILEVFRDGISIRSFRTIDQEFGFGIRQLVDIALKALSPGINDTTTAVMCVDHLAAILMRIANRPMPVCHRSKDGIPRLALPGWSFDEVVETAFDQIRNNALGNVAVIEHLLGAIAAVAEATSDDHRWDTLQLHLGMVEAMAARTVVTEHDRERIRARFDGALDWCGQRRPPRSTVAASVAASGTESAQSS